MKTITRANGKITVSNKKISVTIPADVFESYTVGLIEKKHFHPSGDLQRVETVEQQARQAILSDAMKKLGNAAELATAKKVGRSQDHTEVLSIAEDILATRYLEENCRYDIADTISRWKGGRMMSKGMASDVEDAKAYATGLLAPLGDAGTLKMMAKLTEGWTKEASHREMRRVKLRRGDDLDGSAEQAIAEAIEIFDNINGIDKKHRQYHADMDGWEIAVISPDDMPEQIGTCQYR